MLLSLSEVACPLYSLPLPATDKLKMPYKK